MGTRDICHSTHEFSKGLYLALLNFLCLCTMAPMSFFESLYTGTHGLKFPTHPLVPDSTNYSFSVICKYLLPNLVRVFGENWPKMADYFVRFFKPAYPKIIFHGFPCT